MRFILILRVLSLIAIFASFIYSQSPRLDGRIETDPATGILRGDICLSKLPQQQKYSFLLNRGLNIREIRDGDSRKPLSYDGYYNAVNSGDATLYEITGAVGPGGFCVAYVGAFPVYRVDEGERSELDWKGQIAFDGHTVRAAEQTRFYPVALDSQGTPLDAVSYKLDATCAGCKSIYLNGSKPQAGPTATFSSDTPRQLLLYAGDFPYTSVGNIHFVGANVSAESGEAIRLGMKSVADIHADYIGIAYKDEPVYLTFAAVSRSRSLTRTSWLFVTWPTIARDGRFQFSLLAKEVDSKLVYLPDIFIAHEMAHYYFGSRYVPRGPLSWFLLESTAEFMAMKAQRKLAGDSVYKATVNSHFKEIANGKFTPLNSVTKAVEIDYNYRYRLGPLLLIALEQYAGENVVQKTLAGLINNPPANEVNYQDFRARLLSAGATDEALKNFEAECLQQPTASGCLSKIL